MKNTLFFILCYALMISCSSSVDHASEIKNPEYVYQGAGIEQYFLPELPVWANFSVSSACRRDTSIKYLDFSKLRKSYSLGYKDIVHFQNMFNRRIELFRKNNPTATLYLKDEAYIFNNAYQLLIGGSHDFLIPKYPKVSLVWIDPYLDNISAVKKILQDKEVLKGFPVIVSNCMSNNEMESFVAKNNLDQYGVKYIGPEMFSPYNSDYELSFVFSLDFSKFLDGKEITLFSKYKPKHFLGIKKFIKK